VKTEKFIEKRYKSQLESKLYTTFKHPICHFLGVFCPFFGRNLQGYNAGFSDPNGGLLTARRRFGPGSSSLQLAGFSS
jgi:hypothetical protein